jgi:gliding motility-associated-like protein
MAVNPLLSPSISIIASATSICKTTPVLFTALPVNGGSDPLFKWKKNNSPVGDNSKNYTDSNFANGDLITCVLVSSTTCVANAQVSSNVLSITLYPDPIVTLDKNSQLCEGKTRTLDAGAFSLYLWNTGSKNRSIGISDTGLYAVTVTDMNGCTGTGVTNITTLLAPPSGFLKQDTAICSFDDLLLKSHSVFRKYLWNTGSNNSSISITQPGIYWLQAEDGNGCTGIDSITVHPKECLKGFFMPSAFTPNHDGKNDFLKPILLGKVKKYQFWVYNRWGEVVFHSTDLSKGWDGNFKGQIESTNAFAWMCIYQFEGESMHHKKGTVVLLR